MKELYILNNRYMVVPIYRVEIDYRPCVDDHYIEGGTKTLFFSTVEGYKTVLDKYNHSPLDYYEGEHSKSFTWVNDEFWCNVIVRQVEIISSVF